MSLPGVALLLIRSLPARAATLFARALVLLYLALRPDYRAEVRANLRIVTGRDRRCFWVRNGWRLGRNLALMSQAGARRADALVDRARICGENLLMTPETRLVMASFHFGLWEYLPRVVSRGGKRVLLAVGRQRDAGLNRQLAALRRRRGVELARNLRQALTGGNGPTVVGFMLDNTSQGSQSWTEAGGVRLRMPDFGFRLAERQGGRLAPAFARWDRGRIRVDLYPAGNRQAAARALVAEVRRHPEEWVWWGKAGAIAG